MKSRYLLLTAGVAVLVLLRPLPEEILKGIERKGPSITFETFVKWLDPIRLELHKISKFQMGLFKKLKKKNIPKSHNNKKLSMKKRKRLGLYSLGKRGVSYAEMLNIHELWKEYMVQVINPSQLRDSGWDNSPSHPLFEQLALKLYRVDFHGANLTVIESKCDNLKGAEGIVAIETKNCFKIVTRENLCKTIPKNICKFKFSLDKLDFTFYGQDFIVRPVDRSTKKIKQVKQPNL